ncbi:MAG: translation initiation factor [Rickettsiaceae bacterium]|jgi:tRNA threonylcarbamoyladenosine biosynthesis protein TsaB|nr:translation initiation factor [Rickettsiaceae bacterium]
MSSIILGFDVSQGYCSVAVSNEYQILSSIKLKDTSQQAEMLIPTIEEALIQAKLEYRDIEYIATTTGPGSFTGIRIGLAASQGLLLSLDAKPIAITNFDTICFRAFEQMKKIDYLVTLVNAYRAESYYQIFNSAAEPITLPDIVKNEDIPQIINKLTGNIICAGSGLNSIIPNLNLSKTIYLPRFPIPDARTVCRTAYKKIQSGEYSSNLDPLYIRKADAKLPSKG